LPSRRRIAVLTTGRQDYGLLRSSIRALAACDDWEVRVWAGGTHLLASFGSTIDDVLADGVEVHRRLPFGSDTSDPARDASRAVAEVSDAIRAEAPWALLLAGDRTETLAAALAATLEVVPIAHLHGGEESEGAIDNACRHAITKLAHLHLVSHEVHARRVRQMGEAPDDVIVVGAPGVDNASRSDLPDRAQLERELEFGLDGSVVLVTVHPATLAADPMADVIAVTTAASRVGARYVVTLPNADQGGQQIAAHLRSWAAGRENVLVRESLGERRYWGLLRVASAVLGNSSSGIIEAPSIGVPVVNVGERQRGRLRFGPVRDVAADAVEVEAALRAALAQGRATPSLDLPSGAGARVEAALRAWSPTRPPRKAFRDLP